MRKLAQSLFDECRTHKTVVMQGSKTTLVWLGAKNMTIASIPERRFVEELVEALSVIGKRLQKVWAEALRSACPDRRFVVVFADEPEDYGPTLSFSQERVDS